jgi:hypothetical protein
MLQKTESGEALGRDPVVKYVNFLPFMIDYKLLYCVNS